jgi:uncharacterized membrane protein
MTGENLVLLGQLLGIAFACGLNLYATVALVGLAARLGWIGALPIELQGLENIVIIASATLLYVVEFVVDKVPLLDSLWDTVHTFIRPTAAALLAVGAFSGMPIWTQLAGGILAGSVALVAHGTKAGLRLTINAGPSRALSILSSIAEDVLAVALAIAALRFPAAALILGAAIIVLVAVVGPLLWRAFVLGLRAIAARLRGLFGSSGWREPSEMPNDLRGMLDTATCGFGTPRATRAAVKGLRGVGAYRNGWLILAGDTPVFVYRSLFRPRRFLLPAQTGAQVVKGLFTDVVQVQSADSNYTLFLLKDGPEPELAMSDLAPII